MRRFAVLLPLSAALVLSACGTDSPPAEMADKGTVTVLATGSQFRGTNGILFGPDGYLYGPRWFRGEVVRVDVDTGVVESVADGFGTPAAVKFDSQGRLHVLDTLAGEIVRIGDGFIIEVLDAEHNRTVSAGGLNMPGGLALDTTTGRERLWVADFFALRALDPQTGAEIDVERDVIGVSELGSSMTVSLYGNNLILTTRTLDLLSHSRETS